MIVAPYHSSTHVPIAGPDRGDGPSSSRGAQSGAPTDSVNAFLAALQSFLTAGTTTLTVASDSTTSAPTSGDASDPAATSTDAGADANATAVAAPSDTMVSSLVVPAVVLAAHSAMAAAALIAPPIGTTSTASASPGGTTDAVTTGAQHALSSADLLADPTTADSAPVDLAAWQGVISQLLHAVNAALSEKPETTDANLPASPNDGTGTPDQSAAGAGQYPSGGTSSFTAALDQLIVSMRASSTTTSAFGLSTQLPPTISSVVQSIDITVTAGAAQLPVPPPPPAVPMNAAPGSGTIASLALSAAIVAAKPPAGQGDGDSNTHDNASDHGSQRAVDAAADSATGLAVAAASTPAFTVVTPPVHVAAAAAPAPVVPDTPPVPTAHVTMTLDQAMTGASRIRIAVQGSSVRATIITDDAGVGRIDRDLPALRQALEDQGFSDVRVSVRVDTPTTVIGAPAAQVTGTSADSGPRWSGEQTPGRQSGQQQSAQQDGSQQQPADQQRSPRQGRQQLQEENEG